MTDPPEHLYKSSKNPARLAAELLQHYSFELAGYPLVQQIEIWIDHYPVEWLPFAIIEALYQGRYKAFSVEQILNLWQRRGQPVHHFNHEFERLICGKLPNRDQQQERSEIPNPAIAAVPRPSLSYRKILLELPSVRAAAKLDRLSHIPSLQFPQADSSERPAPSDAESLSLPDAEDMPDLPPQPTPGDEIRSIREVTLPPLPSPPSDLNFQEFKEGVVFGLSSGLAVRSLHPRFRLELSLRYRPDWLSFLPTSSPITLLQPEPSASDRNPLTM